MLTKRCAVLILTLMGLLAGKPGRAADQATLTVLTFNIHHGEGLDGRLDLERIAEVIRESGADLVGLQEVDKGTERTQRIDFPAELSRLTGMSCVFSNNLSFGGGEYGNAILTRLKVRRSENTHFTPLRDGEQRGALEVVLDFDGTELRVINTHLDHRGPDDERVASAEVLVGRLREVTGPVVVLGDFNDVPSSRTYRLITEVLGDAWARVGEGPGFTIPVRNPSRRIDYIFFRGLEPVRGWIPSTEASDHLPLAVVFRRNSDRSGDRE